MPNFVCASETSEWISSAISREEKEYEVFEPRRRPLVAHCPERTPSRDSSERRRRRRRRFERGRLVRTTRDRIFSLRTSRATRRVRSEGTFRGWRWGDGHPMSFSLAAVAAATAARAPVPRAAARSRRDGAPKISARTRQVRASAPRTLPSPAAPKRAPRTGCPRVRLKGQFITWRLRGFWRPTTRPRVAPRWPSSSRPRARRDVGVFTPAPPIRDVAPKSTRRRLTGSLPRSHPPRVSASRE